MSNEEAIKAVIEDVQRLVKEWPLTPDQALKVLEIAALRQIGEKHE